MRGQFLKELRRFLRSIPKRIKAHPFVYGVVTFISLVVLAWTIVSSIDGPPSAEMIKDLRQECKAQGGQMLLAGAGQDVTKDGATIVKVDIEIEKAIVDGVDQGTSQERQTSITLTRRGPDGTIPFVYFGSAGMAAGTKVPTPFSGSATLTLPVTMFRATLAPNEVRGPVGIVYVCFKAKET